MKPHILPLSLLAAVTISGCSRPNEDTAVNPDTSTSIQALDAGSLAKEDYEVSGEDIAYRNGRILFWQARRLYNATLMAFYDSSEWPTASANSTKELCDFLIDKGYLAQDDLSKELLQHIVIAKVSKSDSDDTVFAVSTNYPGIGNSPTSSATGTHVFALSKGGSGGIFHDWSLPASIADFDLPPDSDGFLKQN